MSDGTVEVIGAERLALTLHLAARRLAAMDRATERTAQLIRQRAQGMAPKATGRLAGSISASNSGTEARAASGLIYAGVQEYGWSGHNIRAHPFLRPAAQDSEPVWRTYYIDELDSILDSVEGA